MWVVIITIGSGRPSYYICPLHCWFLSQQRYFSFGPTPSTVRSLPGDTRDPWGHKATAHLEKSASARAQGNPSPLCSSQRKQHNSYSPPHAKGLNILFPCSRHWDLSSHGLAAEYWKHLSACRTVRSFKAADCWRSSHLSSSTWVEKPPLATPGSALCCSLISFLIWCLLWLHITRMFLLWSTDPCVPLTVVFLQWDGSRFLLGRQGKG